MREKTFMDFSPGDYALASLIKEEWKAAWHMHDKCPDKDMYCAFCVDTTEELESLRNDPTGPKRAVAIWLRAAARWEGL